MREKQRKLNRRRKRREKINHIRKVHQEKHHQKIREYKAKLPKTLIDKIKYIFDNIYKGMDKMNVFVATNPMDYDKFLEIFKECEIYVAVLYEECDDDVYQKVSEDKKELIDVTAVFRDIGLDLNDAYKLSDMYDDKKITKEDVIREIKIYAERHIPIRKRMEASVKNEDYVEICNMIWYFLYDDLWMVFIRDLLWLFKKEEG